jgi:diguanylate cyclase (GGDEF)-like protein/PAS domain S-box-containing protein
MLLRANKSWLSLTVAAVALFAVGAYALGLSHRALHWWSDTFWTLFSLVASGMSLTAARRLRGRRRRAWLLVGLGCFAWFLGMLDWDYQELVVQVATPFPALADLGYMILPMCFVAGLFYYRSDSPTATLTLNNVSNLGVIVSASSIGALIVFFPSLVALDASWMYKLTALAYPALFTSALAYALLVTASRPWQDDSLVVLSLTASLAAHTIANWLYAHSLLVGTYQAGSYLDVFWIVAFALVCWAVLEQLAHLEAAAVVPGGTRLRDRIRNIEAVLPVVAMFAVLLTVVIFRRNLSVDMVPYALPFAGLFIVSVAISEWSTRRFEMRLSRESELAEARVRQLLDSTAEAIFGVDVHGRCTFANPACANLLGVGDVHDLIGRDMHAVLTGGQDGGELDITCCTGKPTYLPGVMLWRKDGSRFVAELWSHPLGSTAGASGAVVTFIDITTRRKAEEDLIASERELRNILRSMQDTYFRSDNLCQMRKVSDSAYTLLGYTAKELEGFEISRLHVDPRGRERLVEELRKNGGKVQNYESQYRRKDGSVIWVSTNVQFIRDEQGKVVGMEGTARDVTERKLADAKMYKLSSALEQTADGVMITDRNGVIEYANPAYEIMTGYRRDELLGRKSSILKSNRQGADFFEELWRTITQGNVFSEVFINRKKLGDLYYEAKTISPLKDEQGNITHFVATGKDITDQMETQQQLQHMAHHDALTTLPNRVLFIDRIRQALAAARWLGRHVAILFMDLDRFKNINDTLGHDVGDKLLRQIADRLKASLRDGDTVARFGGDEFVVLLTDVADTAAVAQIAHKILDILLPTFVIDEQEFHITASIGISLFPHDGADSQTLLKNADIAMYRAKESGKNNYKFYSGEMSARAFERLTLENSLRTAIQREEFDLYYQPQIDCDTGGIVGLEALLRWRHPLLGLVSPMDFVPMLEETGLIVAAGEWVVATVCAQMARWRAVGLGQVRVSINISARQFQEKGFRKVLENYMHRFNIEPNLLELEMTESVLMRNASDTVETVDSLYAMDLRLVIDDFGTGYSSLSYLKRFHIDMLKLDKSFVHDIGDDANDAALCSAIILLAKSLNLDVIAEGVETMEQLDFLRAHGCHLVQGYLFSHPLPVAEIEPLLRRRVMCPTDSRVAVGEG